MTEQVIHINQGQKYRMVIERAASTKGVDGFKVEANGDDMAEVEADIEKLYINAKTITTPREVDSGN